MKINQRQKKKLVVACHYSLPSGHMGFLNAGVTGHLRVYTQTGEKETQTRSWRQRKQAIR